MYGRRLLGIAKYAPLPAMCISLAMWVPAGTLAARMVYATADSQIEELWTPDGRARLSKQALAYLRSLRKTRNSRLRVLGIKRLPLEKETTQRFLVSAVVFNYSQGNATRLIIDPSNGAVLREERLRGRPQASEEERQEACQIIRTNLEYARMLEGGGVLEGGFVVDAPSKQSMRDRFIQFQILTADRQGLQRLVIVNLTTGRIAESRPR